MITPEGLEACVRRVSALFEGLPPTHVCWATEEEIKAHTGFVAWAAMMPGDVAVVALRDDLRTRAPRYVIEYLLAHELLHVKLPKRGREWHHKAFRVADRLLPHFARANDWLQRYERRRGQ